MRIGGFVPVSLCDFPGRVAAVVFTRGCNLRCPFCHNGALLAEQPTPGSARLWDAQAVLERLGARRSRLGGVVISGGEPTLQPDLPEFLLAVRALGLSVKLDTNGTRPDVLGLLLRERLLDYVAMDMKAPWDLYPRLCGVACDVASVQLSMQRIAVSGLPHEFRTTRVEPLLPPDACRRLEAQIPTGSRHRWQTFRPEHSLDPGLRQAATGIPAGRTPAEEGAPVASTDATGHPGT